MSERADDRAGLTVPWWLVLLIAAALGAAVTLWARAAAERDRWFDATNAHADTATAQRLEAEGLRETVWELASHVVRREGEMAADTGRLAAENRRLRRRTAFLARTEGRLQAQLDSAEVQLAEVTDDTLRLETERVEPLPAGELRVLTRATVPLSDPGAAVVSHDVTGRFALDVRLLVEEDGTPLCQVSSPGDALTFVPSDCSWRDERPGPGVPDLPSVRVSVGAAGGVLTAVAAVAYLLGRADVP